MSTGPFPQLEEININGTISISSCVVVHEGCPVSLTVVGDEVHAMCGDSPGQGFEFVIQAEPLRAFVHLGANALREINEDEESAA